MGPAVIAFPCHYKGGTGGNEEGRFGLKVVVFGHFGVAAAPTTATRHRWPWPRSLEEVDAGAFVSPICPPQGYSGKGGSDGGEVDFEFFLPQ